MCVEIEHLNKVFTRFVQWIDSISCGMISTQNTMQMENEMLIAQIAISGL